MIPLLLMTYFMLDAFNPQTGFGTNDIINGTYYNISTFSGFFQVTNQSSGGLEQVFLLLIVFLCIWGGATLAGRFNPLLSALGASVIMIPISVFAQIVFSTSGGTAGALMPVVFIGLTLLTAMVSLLAGFKSPYG